jgi:hypothetical protein
MALLGKVGEHLPIDTVLHAEIGTAAAAPDGQEARKSRAAKQYSNRSN